MIKIFKTSDIKNNGIGDKNLDNIKNRKDEIKKRSGLNVNDDIVDISGKSELFSAAKKEIDKIPEIRGEKVESLKEKIDSGEYKIDEGKIADRIIKDHIIDELV